MGEAEEQAVLAVLRSGHIAMGPQVELLERRWAEMCNVRHAIAVSSGTAALHLALLAHHIGAGDEVITTPFSFIATANAILGVGARPVFVDIDPCTYNIDPHLVGKAITKRTKAVLPVHLYGAPCQGLEGLHVPVIEDACQAVGAPVGKLGTACYSLYATKNITCGEGGMITTDDDDVARRARLLRNQGQRARYDYACLGINYRLTDLQAAIALCQLDKLGEWTRARRENARYLSKELDSPGMWLPDAVPGHVYHQYTVRCIDRAWWQDRFAKAGIETAAYYPVPLHWIPHIRDAVGYAYCPQAERAAEEVLSLPVHPGLSDEDLRAIVKAVNG